MAIKAISNFNSNINVNFKKNKKEEAQAKHSGNRTISSVSPKALALAAALMTMQPNISKAENFNKSETRTENTQQKVSKEQIKELSLKDSIGGRLYDKLIKTMDFDNAKVTKLAKDSFKIEADYGKFHTDTKVKLDREDLSSVLGNIKVTLKNKPDSVVKDCGYIAWFDEENPNLMQITILDKERLENDTVGCYAGDPDYVIERKENGELFITDIDEKTTKLSEKLKDEEKEEEFPILSLILATAALGGVEMATSGYLINRHNKNAKKES